MDFISPDFLFLFLPLFMLLFFMSGVRIKHILGVVGSLVFYGWGHTNQIYLMIGLVLFTYIIARLMDRWRDSRSLPFLFWGGIGIVLAVLIGYKLRTDLQYPLGLSYVAFQIIAYIVDVYKSADNSEKDLLKFSFYILLFPKILVGPIVPYRQVRSQISELVTTAEDVADGLRRFIIGLAKKILIADTLATVVQPVFALQSPVIVPSLAWLVIISYSLQLYFDFSGYTDMAIGLGRMMGIRFMENFNSPYLAKNISDFWRRWHISLSVWFREVVFYPLERHRFKWFGQQLNILIVFLLTGLWHGFTRNFLLWGLFHGAALVFESTSAGRKLRNLWLPLQHIYALGVVLVGWVIFRSPTPDFALDYLRRLAGDMRGIQILPFDMTRPLPFIEPTFLLALIAGLLFCLPWNDWLQKMHPNLYNQDHFAVRIIFDAGLFFLFLASLAAAASASYSPGIYGAF